jgi:hypothetical protein
MLMVGYCFIVLYMMEWTEKKRWPVKKRKTLRVAVLAAVLVTLAGCATIGYDARYPICSALPSGVAGCK